MSCIHLNKQPTSPLGSKPEKNCEKAKVGVQLSHVTHDVANLPQTQIPQKVKQAKASTHAL